MRQIVFDCCLSTEAVSGLIGTLCTLQPCIGGCCLCLHTLAHTNDMHDAMGTVCRHSVHRGILWNMMRVCVTCTQHVQAHSWPGEGPPAYAMRARESPCNQPIEQMLAARN